MTMPEINIDLLATTLDGDSIEIARRIVATKGKNKGRLRASKPKVVAGDLVSGEAAYVWRMVAFSASPIGQHHCMPVTAEFDLDTTGMGREDRRAWTKRLDGVADKILAVIPREQHHGTRAWGRAFGYF